MSTARKRGILRRDMARLQDALEAKLYDLLTAHQREHAYFTGPGQHWKECEALWRLHEAGYAAFLRSPNRPGVMRWWITPLGRSYFDINEEHNPPPVAPEPRTLMLLKRVGASREKGEVFSTSPGSFYEEEMLELKRRGYVRSRMITRGHKTGRLSWTITDAGQEYVDGLTVLSRRKD